MFIEWRHRGGEWQADKHHTIDEKYSENDYIYYRQVSATGRNYRLFAALAGVRGDGPEPKGVPDDASEIVKIALGDKSDYHSQSYYSLEEFTEIIQECGYSLSEDTRPIAFYHWDDYDWNAKDGKPKTPTDYICLVHYCNQMKNDYYVDNVILGDDDGRQDIEIRLVFGFDS